jgi:cytoskeletal protein CcmA (bactofilin family)
MFRRKPSEPEKEKTSVESSDELGIPTKPNLRSPAGSSVLPKAGAAPTRPTPLSSAGAEPARPVELSRSTDFRRLGDTVAGSAAAPRKAAETELRTLIVGREIALSGEITSCDRLVVEGSVEANLANCRDIDIAESGLFKGSASIDDAEIRGRFEGVLTVKRRLLIRATGRVIGTVRYGQIEIERGGQISGDIQAQPVGDAAETPESRPAAAVGGKTLLESQAG